MVVPVLCSDSTIERCITHDQEERQLGAPCVLCDLFLSPDYHRRNHLACGARIS